jgi:hypothetical protein
MEPVDRVPPACTGTDWTPRHALMGPWLRFDGNDCHWLAPGPSAMSNTAPTAKSTTTYCRGRLLALTGRPASPEKAEVRVAPCVPPT